MEQHLKFKGIRSVLFDMDGTLVDSEGLTERAVEQALADRGIHDDMLDLKRFHGITWKDAEAILQERYPSLGITPLAAELQAHFYRLELEQSPLEIPGAREAVIMAAKEFPTAIVTSSNRDSVDHIMAQLDIQNYITLIVSAEDYQRSKPHPQCYLLAAMRLGVEPQGCLVFEDSIPGLEAARRASMHSIAITGGRKPHQQVESLADLMISDYTELVFGFFEKVK